MHSINGNYQYYVCAPKRPFTQPAFIEHLLGACHCSSTEDTVMGRTGEVSTFWGLTFLQNNTHHLYLF